MKVQGPHILTQPEAVSRLRAGQTVVIPTETVYGLAANAFDEDACRQIFALKQRPAFNPLIVHIPSADALTEICAKVPPGIEGLTTRFWPGPLTLVLKKSARIPELVTGGLDTVAVRIPAHSVALDLLRATGFPLAAPSANRFKHISPTTVEAAYEELGDAVGYLDGGACSVGLESTILQHTETGWRCLRVGGTPLEKIEAVVGPIERVQSQTGTVLAPGMLSKHYSPRTPLELVASPQPGPETGLLILRADEALRTQFAQVEELCPEGDLHRAATHLFSALRRLDNAGLKKIQAVRVPEQGIGIAINDRLTRAAAP